MFVRCDNTDFGKVNDKRAECGLSSIEDGDISLVTIRSEETTNKKEECSSPLTEEDEKIIQELIDYLKSL